MPVPITDAHVHLWDLDVSAYAWMERAPQVQRTATWEELSAQLPEDVQRVILVQADDTLADTVHLLQLADLRTSATCAVDVVGWLPLKDPERTAELLEREVFVADGKRASTAALVGVRQLIHDDPDPYVLDSTSAHRSLQHLAVAGLPLDMPDAWPRHMTQVKRLASRHEELTLVLDHLGKPPLGDAEAMDAWSAALRSIAAYPQTVAKLSGLATSGNGDPGEQRRAVETALDTFGASRLMFGSDWPIAPEPFTGTSGTRVVRSLIAELTSAEQEAILYGTAKRTYARRAVLA